MDRLREVPPAALVLVATMAGFVAVQLGAVSSAPGDAVAVSAPNTPSTSTTAVRGTVGTSTVPTTALTTVQTTDAAPDTTAPATAPATTRRPATTRPRPRTTQAPATTAPSTTVAPVAEPTWSAPVESTTTTTAPTTTAETTLPEDDVKAGDNPEVWVTAGPDGWHGVLTSATNKGTIFSVRNSLEPAPRVFELSAGQAISFSGGATMEGASLTITVDGAVLYRAFYEG